MKIAAVAQGVKSVSIEGDGRDQVVVTGDGVDSVQLTNVLRKKLRHATLMSVQDVKLEDKKDEEDKKIKPIEYFGYYNYNPHPPNYSYQVVYDPYHNNCSIM
ncbi:heavy metal-associated isoprenylated plant protein 47-like [Senna tora]|uniref:Heavy metal-associated isoprenylated plant protein 47-like n=1 Tax=Senna tora TaxID=362788 RepID=A0A834WT87_9FABA|nr:heavy metal-associated isoprenylated plant protein 47-like [Senna tora]